MQDTLDQNPIPMLDRPLTALLRFTVESALWLGIVLFTVLTRFWDLGSRAYNHDESLHTLYSWYLYQGRGYIHDPMMHGPFQFHLNTLIFFLLGDSDYTGRILYAVFGVIAVILPFYLRRYLGRAGALLAAVGIAVAPDIMYYSRFARNDILHLVWSLLAIIGLFGFIRERKPRYFVLGAAAISLMWATKETVFIFGFSALSFLVVVFVLEGLRRGNWNLITAVRSLDLVTAVIAIVTALAIFAILYTTLFTNFKGLETGAFGAIRYWLAQQDVKRGDQPWYYYLVLLPIYNFMPLLPALIGTGYYAFRRNTATLSFGVSALLTAVMAIAVFGHSPAAAGAPAAGIDPALIAAFICAFGALGSGVVQLTRGKRTDGILLLAGGFGFLVASFILADVLLLRSAVPPAADAPKAFAIEPGVVLFLIVLGWAVASLTVAVLRGRSREPLFTAFVVHWLLTSFIIYSWAGEKMPWLSLHMSLPAIVLAAQFLNDMWSPLNWSSLRARGALWLALIVPLVGYSIIRLFAVAPFQGISLQRLDATLQWFATVVIGAGLIYAGWWVARRLSRREALQVIAASLMLLLLAATIRYAIIGSFEHGDVAVEMLIYAQGAPDVPVVVRDIETMSFKLTGGRDMDIVVESSETWPFAWYLRNYTKVAYPGSLEGPPTAPIVIAGYENESRYKPWMSNYIGVKRKLIWWFAEDYKGMTPQRIADLLSKPENRESLLNFLLYRKFEVPLGQWPLRKEFTFYVRRDVASLIWTPSQLPPPDVERQDKDLQDKFVTAAPKLVIGQRGTEAGQFNGPKGIAALPDGSLLVADSSNHRIQKLDADGKPLLAFGTQGGGDGQFQEPWSVAAGPDGSIYVADTWNHRVQKFDASGKFVKQWGTFGDTAGTAAPDRPLVFYGPRAIAVDAQGNVWVVDTGNKRIVKFNADGQPLGAFGGLGTGVGLFAEPVGIAVDPKSGDILVADTWNRRVQRFSKDFKPLSQWSVLGWDTTSVVNKPYLVLDSDGNIYATDPEGQRVVKYAPDGKLLAYFGKFGADANSFNLPTGIVVDAQGNIFVADSGNNRIAKFDPVSK
ncbi:MAG: TIGR03663 family protein [Chloroflexi bacterium]|nr:TIGR03663 family protein [Chloroflexota bacterium]